jgi:GT2 family glycosyltransferase
VRGEAPSHSIVIPTIGRAALLERTLDALAAQTHAPHEVIVVCDGPDPSTEALGRRWPAPYPIVWLFQGENRGPAAARNAGAAAARGDVLLFLDDETLPDRDWLAQHLQHHRENGMVVVGRLRDVYERSARSFVELCMREYTALRVSALHAALLQPDGLAEQAWVGLNASIWRDTFMELGGFDERLRFVQEDAELGTRARRSGVEFRYEPLALVTHVSSKDLAAAFCETASHSGWSDVYRAHVLRERLPGAYAAKMAGRSPLRRGWESLVCSHPEVASCAGSTLARLAGATRSKYLFWRWAGLSFAAGYWRGVHTWHLDRRALRTLFPAAAE